MRAIHVVSTGHFVQPAFGALKRKGQTPANIELIRHGGGGGDQFYIVVIHGIDQMNKPLGHIILRLAHHRDLAYEKGMELQGNLNIVAGGSRGVT